MRKYGCVISFFYIKPQPLQRWLEKTARCVISFFYIKPQPLECDPNTFPSCVISFFYIKPQLSVSLIDMHGVVLYLSSTSNHNPTSLKPKLSVLCYIFLLHQTTTVAQTALLNARCVISFFYIKPQRNSAIYFRA